MNHNQTNGPTIVKLPTGEGNRALLGIDGAEDEGKLILVQIGDGSFVEMTAKQVKDYEGLSLLQRMAEDSKLSAAQELNEMQELQRGGSDAKGKEFWQAAMRQVGRY